MLKYLALYWLIGASVSGYKIWQGLFVRKFAVADIRWRMTLYLNWFWPMYFIGAMDGYVTRKLARLDDKR